MSIYCSKDWLLREAARRSQMFHRGEPLTEAWTGLGSATLYKPVVNAGLMECATTLNPGYSTWWRLTEKGAAIVQKMIREQEPKT